MADPLAKRPIGRTGVEVTTLGFGGNVLGNLYAPVDDAVAKDTVLAAWQSGVTYFDTAPLYGHGLSERRLGDALRDLPRDDIVLSTKVGRLLVPHGRVPPPKLKPSEGGIFTRELPFQPRFDFSYDATMRSFEDSLQRLGMNRIDMLLIHDADEWSQGERYREVLRTVETGTLKALRKLKDEGVIGAYGAGVNESVACENLMDIGPFDCFLLAGRYTLLEQGALDGLLPRAAREGVSIILGAPFNSGILVTGAVEDARYNYLPAPPQVKARVAAIERVARAQGVPLAAAALQFVLGHPAVTTVIPGAKSRAEAEQNARWMTTPIPAAFWADLKAEGLVREDAPTP
jgi:D-threo-aldose 1-dehydrogenase